MTVEKYKNFRLFFTLFVLIVVTRETIIFYLGIYLILKVILSYLKQAKLIYRTKIVKFAEILDILIFKNFFQLNK